MKGTSGEPERVEARGALSRPLRLKPVPALLSLSVRQFYSAHDIDRPISLTRLEAEWLRILDKSQMHPAFANELSRKDPVEPG